MCNNIWMGELRNTKLIASFMLVWFALFLGSAVASTILKPGGLQMVCSSAGGMKLVDVEDSDGESTVSVSVDCPMCASIPAPPPPTRTPFETPSPLAYALQPIAAAHIASVTAPPLPSRGPPSYLV